MKTLFNTLYNTLQSGENAVLCSVIASSGSAPRGAGAKMIVYENGKTFGTIGGGAVEHVSTQLAVNVHKTGKSAEESFRLRKNDVADLGMICGGDVTVYFQYFSAADEAARDMLKGMVELLCGDEDAWLILALEGQAVAGMGVYDEKHGIRYTDAIALEELKPLLKGAAVLTDGDIRYYVEPLVQSLTVYIFGGGHVSQELVPVIAHVGFRSVVFEDREEFAHKELFPGVAHCVIGDFEDFQKEVSIRQQDYIVIMTRGHQADYDVLVQALRTQAAYIGLIGSRHKMALTRKRLMDEGFVEADMKRIHNPIGVEILAETPAEIAISIAGEMIQARAMGREG
ncbi:XdhC family protein [Christensenellaceae bacterium OttesenSCG-928-M15]|nr:XdhC family protein [Christensenellaceae bacterium OttesenSCG-928-M15]